MSDAAPILTGTTPTVSIGVVVHAKPAELQATIAAVETHTTRPFELVLLPDGPDAATRATLLDLDRYRQWATAHPAGGAACLNRLAQETGTDVVVLLESGALVSPGWLDRLLEGLYAEPRNGLAGPSTNRSWNEQEAFPEAGGSTAEIARTTNEAVRHFETSARTLEPLHSLADFCYVVRREVIDAIGLADEGYGAGPCWEMDYNIRAARAGWRGVWVGAAYVFRSPVTPRRAEIERRLFAASRQRYQDKFCGARLRGEKHDFRAHCRGDACPNFAPAGLIRLVALAAAPVPLAPVMPASVVAPPPPARTAGARPLVTCIMPTCDRLAFVPDAIRCFLGQDYPELEMVVVDDGRSPVAPLLPANPRFRLIRLPAKQSIGAKRNLACAAAAGEFIVHWDDDDWYPADRVSRQVAALAAGGEICGTSTLYYHDAQAGRAWRYCYQRGGRPWVAGNTLAYRKSWWQSHPFPAIQIGEDSRFVWAAPKPAVLDLARPDLCVARIHPGNTSRKAPQGTHWVPCTTAEIAALTGAEWMGRPPRAGNPTETNWPLVSCIMPTCNRRALLPLALRAYAAQSYPARELIVVDDGTDPVGDLVAGLAGVRYVRLTSRLTIGEKRNRACAEARGEIIAHWDDDDWYAPGRLHAQTAPLLAGTADLTGLDNSCTLELPAARFWSTRADLHRRMFVGDVHGGTLVYWKRILAAGVRYPALNLAEDAALLRAAMRSGRRLTHVANDGLFVYVRHGHNSWHYTAGQYLDANGWCPTAPPPGFSAAELQEWRTAAAQLHGTASV